MPASNHVEKKTLVVVLVINAGMFVVEIITGLISESTALIADSLDMLADASVYGLGLYAVGRSLAHKTRAAMTSGVLQILLGGLVLADILRRLLVGSEPLSIFMIGIGLLALTANITCLVLIAKYRRGEIHMRATWIFSRNDVIANLGIILGGPQLSG